MFAPGAGAQVPNGVRLFHHESSTAVLVDSARAPDQGAISVWQVAFDSPGGGKVTGILGVPAPGGRRPGIVVLHGLPGSAASAMTSVGHDLAERGAVVLSIDAPWARRNGFIDFTPRDSVEQVQVILDLQRAVDVLVAREDVDANSIGFVGGSWGAAMGGIFVGVERRLRAAVLIVPAAGMVARYTDSLGAPLGLLAEQSDPAQQRWLAAMRPIEPWRFASGSSPTPVLVQNGLLDNQIPLDDARLLHDALGEPKEIRWYQIGHSMASFPQARADRIAFLARELGIRPDPTP